MFLRPHKVIFLELPSNIQLYKIQLVHHLYQILIFRLLVVFHLKVPAHQIQIQFLLNLNLSPYLSLLNLNLDLT